MTTNTNTPTQLAAVGPKASELKSRFLERSIPLESDFASLIDVADCGRKAAGLSPDVTPRIDTGLVLDSVTGQLMLAVGQIFMPGMVMMYSGATAPDGWAFCDGGNGRPDLRNKFVLGGGGSEAGASGGSVLTGSGNSKKYNANVDAVAATNVNITVNGTALTEAQMPAHKHLSGIKVTSYPGCNELYQYGYTTATPAINQRNSDLLSIPYNQSQCSLGYSETKGSGATHNHTGTITLPQHTHTITTLPAYYILAFIIKL